MSSCRRILNDASHFLDVSLYGDCTRLFMRVHPIGGLVFWKQVFFS